MSDKTPKRDNEYWKQRGIIIGMLLGVPLGIPFGLAMGNIAVGIGVGAGIGVSLGVAIGEGLERKYGEGEAEMSPGAQRALKVFAALGALVFLVVLAIYFFLR